MHELTLTQKQELPPWIFWVSKECIYPKIFAYKISHCYEKNPSLTWNCHSITGGLRFSSSRTMGASVKRSSICLCRVTASGTLPHRHLHSGRLRMPLSLWRGKRGSVTCMAFRVMSKTWCKYNINNIGNNETISIRYWPFQLYWVKGLYFRYCIDIESWLLRFSVLSWSIFDFLKCSGFLSRQYGHYRIVLMSYQCWIMTIEIIVDIDIISCWYIFSCQYRPYHLDIES